LCTLEAGASSLPFTAFAGFGTFTFSFSRRRRTETLHPIGDRDTKGINAKLLLDG
jgi:hypothetical protein